MFIMSIKLNNSLKKAIPWILFLFLLGAIILLNIKNNLNHQTQSENLNPISFDGKTNESRINFFKQYGWKTDNEPCEITEVVIPQKFDETFQEYNEMQKRQQMDLSKYKGKLVKHYSYEILNYPNQPQGIRGNLLVYEGQIIASDICSLALDGFMHEVNNKEN